MTILLDKIKLKRGSQSAVDAITLERGEPAVAMDTRTMWFGDGTGKIKISDVVISSNYASLPTVGESGKLYLVITDETLDNEPSMYVFKAAAYTPVTTGNGTITASDITNLTTFVNTIISDTWRGQIEGLAPLDTGGKIPNTYLPDLAITDVHVVNDNSARDALSPQAGDIAIVTGTNTTYIWTGSSWQEMLTAPDGVMQVNGMSGPNVTLSTSHISEGTNLYFTDSRAKTAVLDDSAGIGVTNLGWSANKLMQELAAHDMYLGSKAVSEAAIGDGKTLTYNATSGNIEYHAIVIDGGEL